MAKKTKKASKAKRRSTPKKAAKRKPAKKAKKPKWRMKNAKLFNVWLKKPDHKVMMQKARKYAGGNASELVRKAVMAYKPRRK